MKPAFILRVFVGLALAGHGAQKLFGWWGGPGVRGFLGHSNSCGSAPLRSGSPGRSAPRSAVGFSLRSDCLSPLGSVGVGAAMLMAIAPSTGARASSVRAAGSRCPALPGPRVRSSASPVRVVLLDSLFNITLPEPVTGIVAAALAVAGVAVAMAGRRPALQEAPAQLAADAPRRAVWLGLALRCATRKPGLGRPRPGFQRSFGGRVRATRELSPVLARQLGERGRGFTGLAAAHSDHEEVDDHPGLGDRRHDARESVNVLVDVGNKEAAITSTR